MSSSLRSRATLPATSALVIAASTIRSVEERTSSRDFIATVRSLRSRSLSSLMPPLCSVDFCTVWQPCRVTPTHLLTRALGAGAALGSGVTAYAVWEARAYTLRSVEVPLLPAGARPLRVLHLSDLHLTPGQSRKREWVRSLADLEPDLVVSTGDNMAHVDALPALLEALGPLLDVPGVFVLGSNDYFAPILRNPLAYLLPDDGTRVVHTTKLPWRDLVDAYTAAGWTDLTNSRTRSSVRDLTVAWAGVDDPHLNYDDLAAVAGPAEPDADLRLAIAHAPYRRVLDQFAADGYDA